MSSRNPNPAIAAQWDFHDFTGSRKRKNVANSDSRDRKMHRREKMDKQQLIELGAKIEDWPTFEHYSQFQIDIIKEDYGDVVGIVYDTSSWPVPGETYHADNWRKWHLQDPNRPMTPSERERETGAIAQPQ